MDTILRGDIFLCKFGSSDDHTIQKTRPVVIIQNNLANRVSQTTIVTIITGNPKVKQLPVVVEIEPGRTGLDKISYVNLGHIYTIDRKSLLRKLGTVPSTIMQKIEEAINISLGMKEMR